MANLACGRRLSLRNQYDTKTPRARIFFALVKRTALSSGRFVAHPARSRDMLASRKNLQRGFRNVRRKLFSKKEFEKFPRGSRSTAGLMLHRALRNVSKVILNVAFGQEGRKPS